MKITRKTTKVLLIIFFSILFLYIGVKTLFWYEGRQLEKLLDSLEIPQNLEFVVQSESGNRACLDACLGKSRTYRIKEPIENPAQILQDIVGSGDIGITNIPDCELPSNIRRVGAVCYASAENDRYRLSASYVNNPNGSKLIKVSLHHNGYLGSNDR